MKRLLTIFVILLLTVSGCSSSSEIETAAEFSRKDGLSAEDYLKYSSPDYIIAEFPSGSMANTIMIGDTFIADKTAYISNNPERFDIIIFNLPGDEDNSSVKRIIGLPGETLEIKDGLVFINNSSVCLSEPYLCEQPEQRDFESYVIPDNHYFLMGDNRNYSYDSRVWQEAYIPFDLILGKAIIVSTAK